MQTKFAPLVVSLALVCSGAQLVAAQKQLVLKPTPGFVDQAKALPGKIQEKWNGATPAAKGVALAVTGGLVYSGYRLVSGGKKSQALGDRRERRAQVRQAVASDSSNETEMKRSKDVAAPVVAAPAKGDADNKINSDQAAQQAFFADVANEVAKVLPTLSDRTVASMSLCMYAEQANSIERDAQLRVAALQEKTGRIRAGLGHRSAPRSAGSVQDSISRLEQPARLNVEAERESATNAQLK